MQCYQYLAAIITVAEALDSLPGINHKLPHSAIALWMDENGIDAEAILFASGDDLKLQIEAEARQNQPCLQQAA